MSKRMLVNIGVAGLIMGMAGLAHGQAAAPAAQPAAAQPSPVEAAPVEAVPVVMTATLRVGDKAPALSIEKFVHGDAVTGFEKGKVYVVEFWATWCGPCVRSMPHLTKLQTEYKDKGVTIIGVTTQDPRNSLADVEKMVGEKVKSKDIGYTIGWDKGQATQKAYMEAALQNGIPTAFVVDQTGVVAWVGGPRELDEVLEQVVAGTWDMSKAKAAFEQDLKSAEAQMIPGNVKRALRKADYATAAKQANEGINGPLGEDPQFLNAIAWVIVDPANKFDLTKNPAVLDAAVKAAEKSNDLTEGKDPSVLDTYATALFAKGDKAKAIQMQSKAVDAARALPEKAMPAAQREQMVKELAERLEQFKNTK